MTYAQKIAAIAAEIASVLKPEFDANIYAAGMLDEADDDETHFEVRGLHTVSGVPYAFWAA